MLQVHFTWCKSFRHRNALSMRYKLALNTWNLSRFHDFKYLTYLFWYQLIYLVGRRFNTAKAHPINFNLALSSLKIITFDWEKFVLLVYKFRDVLFKTWLIWIQIRYDFWAMNRDSISETKAERVVVWDEGFQSHIIYHNLEWTWKILL